MAVNANILVPVTDAIVETSWGIDVADTLNWVYDNKLSLTGGTLTGNLAISNGHLSIVSTIGMALRLRSTDNSPYVDFHNGAGTVRQGYVMGGPTGLQLATDGSMMQFTSAGGFERMRLLGGEFLVGKQDTLLSTLGTHIASNGRVNITTNTGLPLYLRRDPVFGAAWVQFAINDGPGSIASDIRGATVGMQFTNCVATAPSDYRLKDDLGPVTDALDRLMALEPKHLRWNEASGMEGEFDGFIAHELAAAVPDAVYGEKDAVNEDGSIESQQVNFPAMIPLIVAAIQELAAKVEAV